jgi:hypothetical protein
MSLKGCLFHPGKERESKVELASTGPPSGHIFQPGLMELTSWWRDVPWSGSLTSLAHSPSPGLSLATWGQASQQLDSWARTFQNTGAYGWVLVTFAQNST